jgi:uncharacterized protein YeaO (DUF488 family)
MDPVAIHVVRLGSPRLPNEGLRLGTVRRPPRGVRKENIATGNWYDQWLPQLAPSADLVRSAQAATDTRDWDAFARQYRKEMSAAPDNARLIALLAALSHTTNLAVGCYCEDETRCHRSTLRELLAEGGADITSP